MSFPRLALLVLGLPLLTGGCAVTAVTAASYGADGASYAETGKTTTDHFASMVSKKDCALFRVFHNENVCHARPDGKDPYRVSYDTAERMPSEDGVSYAPPLRQTPDEPSSSWTAEAYAKKAEPGAASAPAAPAAPVVAASEPAPPPVEEKPVAPKPAKKKAKAHAHPKAAVAHAKPDAKTVRKASPNQVASVP
jgi:hypothetical protein